MSFTESTKPIRCPVCSTTTEIPVGGINRLPLNFMLMRRVKLALVQLGQELNTNVWCTLCYTAVIVIMSRQNQKNKYANLLLTQAIAFCLICNTNLCEICRNAHIRQKNTSMHDVRYLNDLQGNLRGPSDAVLTKKILKCSIHPTHDLKLYCTSCYQVGNSNRTRDETRPGLA